MEQEGKAEGDKFRQNKKTLNKLESQKKDISVELIDLRKKQEILRSQERALDQFTLKQAQIQNTVDDWQKFGEKRLDELNEVLHENRHVQEDLQELEQILFALDKLEYDGEQHKRVKDEELNGRQSETRLRELESAKAALEPVAREITEIQKKIQKIECFNSLTNSFGLA